MTRIGVLGAGSWGTALAIHAASAGHEVLLWARRSELVEQLQRERENRFYLPDVAFPATVTPTDDLGALAELGVVMVVVPSHGYREVLSQFLPLVPPGSRPLLVSGTKGIEIESLNRMSEVSHQEAQRVGREIDFSVLSGPSFAAELARQIPTAAVVAASTEEVAARIQQELSTTTLRLYTTTDLIGVELGGTTKNVIAIAAGVVAGLGLGYNTAAALITRGLHEITRLGVACGGDPRTASGLAGLGDLVLTCTGGLSRNRKVGVEIAKGKTLDELTGPSGMVAEGVRNSLAVARLADRVGVEMPITSQIMRVLYEGLSPRDAITELMTRELKSEAQL